MPSHELTIPIKITIRVERPGQEALDAIQEDSFPNKRQYKAAYYLCELEQGIAYVPSYSSEDAELKKCKFILSDATIASKYLTLYDGYLYVQAVKENFTLPFDVPDEDEEVKNNFDEFFIRIAEESPQLAVDIWVWLIKQFGPYKQYMKNDRTIYNSIISSAYNYPSEFLLLSIKKLGDDIEFCNELLTEIKQFPYSIVDFIMTALKENNIKEGN